jgi:lymphatic vessel endothelial hyaluronan receptor 1
MARKTKKICITEVYTEPITMATETEAFVASGAAFKNEAAGFGGECLLGLHGHEQL